MNDIRSPLISIITPTFNHEKFISECIESVLAQTYKNWEQVIIDDGSTDRTGEIVRSYSDPRIHYFWQENQGIEALAHTYNRALSMSKGVLVAILEGDDLWPPDKLSMLVPAFADQGIVLAYGAVADVGTDGSWSGRLSRSVRQRMRLPKEVLCNNPTGTATRYILRAEGSDLVWASTVVIRRCALDSIGGFQYSPDLFVTDLSTVLTLSLTGRFHYVPQVMGYQRRHPGSATHQNLDKLIAQAHRYVERFLNEHSFPLSPEERKDIQKSWNCCRPSYEFTKGRVQLLNRNWKSARVYFVRAMDPSDLHVFAAALVGWCLSWLHRDLEGPLALVGAARLEAARPRGVGAALPNQPGQ